MLLSFIYKYRHFENILLILIKQNYDLFKSGKDANDFNILTNKQTLRNALMGYKSKKQDNTDYLVNKYKDNQLFKDLTLLSKNIKQHNFTYIINRVKSQYKTFFTAIKSNAKARLPKAKKLSKITNYSIDVDKDCSLSFKKLAKHNLIGINLSDKMFYVHCYYDSIKSLIDNDINNLNSAKLVYDNGLLYLNVSYYKEIPKFTSDGAIKESGLDIGVNNLVAIFVNDEETKSLIIDGKPYKKYNSDFNRLISKLNISKSNEVLEWGLSKNGTKYPKKYSIKGIKINKFISFLYQKRNRYFDDNFHKISVRILEYLKNSNVTDLYISKNLAELKSNGKCKLRKSTKQNFIQIPFFKLLNIFEYKAAEFSIMVHSIDEAYTSKTSCISDNVVDIQNNRLLSNAFNGKRDKRGLFKDTLMKKVFNADLNGAVNHIKVGTSKSFEWLKNYLFKLCNPIKIKCDCEFIVVINSVSGKSNNLTFNYGGV
jgi:IS605 OrfB family transposase